MLEQLIRDFADEQAEMSDLLLRRFRDNESTQQLAFEMHRSIDHVNRLQRTAIENLANFLEAKEEAARKAEAQRQLSSLPPKNYQTLIGRERLLDQLVRQVSDPQRMEVIAICGLGGSGKTALADALARRMAGELSFAEIVWLQAQPEEPDWAERALPERLIQRLDPGFPLTGNIRAQLGGIFKERPILVFVDAIHIGSGSEAGLNQMLTWTGPSKFVLTSRELPSPGSNLHTVKLHQLSPLETEQFLVAQATALGLNKAQAVLKIHAAEVFQLTGGNPLALKLVTGLLHYWPISTVLQALKTGASSKTKGLFSHIYQASWAQLNEQQQDLLLTFLLSGEQGVSAQQLTAIAANDQPEQNDDLLKLVSSSLVEMRRSVEQPSYGVHQLTYTFLTQSLNEASEEQRTEFRRRVGQTLDYWEQALQTGFPTGKLDADESNLMRAVAFGLQAGEHREKAARLLVAIHPYLQGRQAAERWLELYRQAQRILSQYPEQAISEIVGELAIDEGALLWQLGDQQAALEAFQRGFEVAEALGLLRLAARALLGKGLAQWRDGAYPAARQTVLQAGDLLRGADAGNLSGALEGILAMIACSQGRYPTAIKQLARAVNKTPKDRPAARGRLLMHRGLCAQLRGDLPEALRQYRRAAKAVPAQSPPSREQATIDLLRSSVFYQLGDLENANAALQRVASHEDYLDEIRRRALFESSLGRLALAEGNPLRAADLLKGAARLWKKAGEPAFEINTVELMKQVSAG